MSFCSLIYFASDTVKWIFVYSLETLEIIRAAPKLQDKSRAPHWLLPLSLSLSLSLSRVYRGEKL